MGWGGSGPLNARICLQHGGWLVYSQYQSGFGAPSLPQALWLQHIGFTAVRKAHGRQSCGACCSGPVLPTGLAAVERPLQGQAFELGPEVPSMGTERWGRGKATKSHGGLSFICQGMKRPVWLELVVHVCVSVRACQLWTLEGLEGLS